MSNDKTPTLNESGNAATRALKDTIRSVPLAEDRFGNVSPKVSPTGRRVEAAPDMDDHYLDEEDPAPLDEPVRGHKRRSLKDHGVKRYDRWSER